MGEGSKCGTGNGGRYPLGEIAMQVDFPLLVQGQSLPSADWRDPEFILCLVQDLSGASPEPLRIDRQPEPNVRIQEELQSRSASHSSLSVAGEMISPRIIESFNEPIHFIRSPAGGGGTTLAAGCPGPGE